MELKLESKQELLPTARAAALSPLPRDATTTSTVRVALLQAPADGFSFLPLRLNRRRIPAEIVNFCDGVIGCGLFRWVITATSTLAFRLALLPVVVLQLLKLRKIEELSPKLPPPLPPPQSGRSFIDQISLFSREAKARGCPSFLWFLASLSIQVPCFLLGVTRIWKMSLEGHAGFDREHRMYDALSMEFIAGWDFVVPELD
ncbi:hypothetical protein Patl1_24105 [Pistacia atlantica]|uniref:Uncharacterized protein n=1 Tax=Pistacia atlantica TaxID=434234 RepID=A0ACC0ZT99_9ROSI|nr:hypothetical protein Patl1_24105 [Pistacia atlantica]